MPRKLGIVCDGKDCREELGFGYLGDTVASRWVRRTVVDTVGPRAPGASGHSAQQEFFYCPKHADELSSPALAAPIVTELARRDVDEESGPGDG